MIDGYIEILKEYNRRIINYFYKDKWTEQKIADHFYKQVKSIQKTKEKSIEFMQRLYENNNLGKK